jgi:adenylate cyclase
VRVLTPYLAMMTEYVRRHDGQPVGSRGDSLLAEFPRARSAVQCAIEMQRELKVRNAELPAEQRIAFRMGIHVGEIVADGEQLHGDGINIAARLESLAEAGGILISGTVYDQVKTKLPLKYEDIGEQHLKNIAEPVRAYRIVLEIPS